MAALAPTAPALTCPHCNRTFADREALFCHAKAKHGLKKSRACVPEHPSVVREAKRRAADARRDAEPSMADLVVEAQIARSMGEPVDSDIAEMFDV